MAKKPGKKQLSCWLDEGTVQALEGLADAHGRSLVQELTHAIMRHCEAPPVVTVHTPPMEPCVVEPPARKRRGPKRKAKGGA